MKLTQPEVIQILRRRLGLNQGDFGAKAFGTSFESGRTKVKNIELGKQVPSEDELVCMADVFGTDVSVLKPETDRETRDPPSGSALVNPEVLERFPELATYLDMLNKAAKLEDSELIDYIAGKIATVFSGPAAAEAAGGSR
jgi:hypothetical protein